MKKVFSAMSSIMVGLPLLAADGDTVVLDNTMVNTLNTNLTNLGSDLGKWADKVMPVILTVVGVFMLFWLLKFALRLIKSFSSTSK